MVTGSVTTWRSHFIPSVVYNINKCMLYMSLFKKIKNKSNIIRYMNQ